MAFIAERIAVLLGRPGDFAFGMSGPSRSHSACVRIARKQPLIRMVITLRPKVGPSGFQWRLDDAEDTPALFP